MRDALICTALQIPYSLMWNVPALTVTEATRLNVTEYHICSAALNASRVCLLAGPFSHRTMLTLEEKGIPYNKLLLDESSIPEWCVFFKLSLHAALVALFGHRLNTKFGAVSVHLMLCQGYE